MSEHRRLEARIYGVVQGVWYRASTRDQANRLGGLTGWVRNRVDGSVELMAEGPEDTLGRLLAWCRKGPPGASVDEILETWAEPKGEFSQFHVRY